MTAVGMLCNFTVFHLLGSGCKAAVSRQKGSTFDKASRQNSIAVRSRTSAANVKYRARTGSRVEFTPGALKVETDRLAFF